MDPHLFRHRLFHWHVGDKEGYWQGVMGNLSTLGIVGGLTAVCLFALAAILFVAPSEESMQRLGLFFGMIGVVITTLVGMLRSDQAAKQTNGSLDARIQTAVRNANKE